MPVRARLALMLFTTLVLVGALGVVVFHDGSGPTASGDTFEGAIPPAMPPHDFSLRDQDGRRVRLAAFRGRPVIVSFMYSTCQDTCPVTTQQIRGALDDLGHDVPVLAISVDPANDTPLNAKRYLLRQHMLGRMQFLLGSRKELRPVWDAYHIRPQGNGFEHSAYVLLIDAAGRQRVSWPTDRLTPAPLARDLVRLGA